MRRHHYCNRLHDACCFGMLLTGAASQALHAVVDLVCAKGRMHGLQFVCCQPSQVDDLADLAATCKICCSSTVVCAESCSQHAETHAA